MEMHPATLWEAIADRVPDHPALVQGARRVTWGEFDDRASRLAAALVAAGVAPGDTVGLLLRNAPEYVEAYLAALKVRAVPFNVNHRYTAEEVAYLLDDADAVALVFHASLGSVAAGAVERARVAPRLLVEVDDPGGVAADDGSTAGSRGGVGRGPVGEPYEAVLAAHDPAARIARDPDDRTMTYTGGTTGLPKGVVATVGPALEGLIATVPPLIGEAAVPIDEVPALAARLAGEGRAMVSLPASPLMHGTGMLIGTTPTLAVGGTIVLLEGRRFDPAEMWDTVARERVTAVTIVGDPFARPMRAELDARPGRDLSSLRSISSAGAMFSQEEKDGLLVHLPQLLILDFVAATEGSMGMSVSTAASPAPTARFRPGPGVILIDATDRPLPDGSTEPGLVAIPGATGRYHGDDVKTAATFRTIDGERYSVPGDWAVRNDDGTLTLLGRGSACINTAGEKVFAEEVEEALKAHPAVADALVFGVPDDRYGQRVAAVVARTPGRDDPVDDVLAEVRDHLASYKVPRSVAVVDEVPRTQVGKPDYPGARALFDAAS